MKRVRQFAVGMAAVLPLLLIGTATGARAETRTSSEPCAVHYGSGCPAAGKYRPYPPTGTPPVIYASTTEPAFDVTWTGSTVKAPTKGPAPRQFDVSVTYTNRGTGPETFTCNGVSDPRLDKEWLYRAGKVVGYVEASETYCSAHPGATFTLQPQQAFNVYASFQYLPMTSDRVAIEWGSLNRSRPPTSPFVSPYAQGQLLRAVRSRDAVYRG